jgi:hypothetical protein
MIKFNYKNEYSGSALILTMFIMAGMLIVALGSAYVVLLGIRSGSTQAQSVQAYFAAEAGAEQLIRAVRIDYSLVLPPNVSATPLLSGQVSSATSSSYEVFYTKKNPQTFTSVGDYYTTQRSVEIEFAN